jgi:Icc protein
MFAKIISLALLLTSTCVCINFLPAALAQEQVPRDYKRIVIISDAHYPSKSNRFTHSAQWRQRVTNKQQAAHDINNWQDVDLLTFTGDMVALTGSEYEREIAKSYVDSYTHPKVVIPGNHEFTYKDIRKANGKLVHASLPAQKEKLQAFQKDFGLRDLYSARRLQGYELIFLATEPVTGKHLCELSSKQLTWLEKKLIAHPELPTIIFFHAPLDGTLAKTSPVSKGGNLFAEPNARLEKILLQHPQIKLWVSGHTHTPPANPSFDSPRNYKYGILDVYNPTLDGKQVWTNSLYLYPDKIVIKTFDHKKQKFLENFTRTVPVKNQQTRKAA